MQQIEHGVTATRILQVARRRIDRHAAVSLQRRAVIPHFRHIAMRHLVHAIEIALIAFFSAHNKDVGVRGDVATHINIARVEHIHAIHPELIRVKLAVQPVGGIGPQTYLLLIFRQLHIAWLFHHAHWALHLHLRQEVARQLHLHRLRRIEAESDGSVGIHFRRDNVVSTKQSLLRPCVHRQQGQG